MRGWRGLVGVLVGLGASACATGDVVIVDGSGGATAGAQGSSTNGTGTTTASTSSSATSASSGATSSGASSSSGAVECALDGDCPGPTACASFHCVGNHCAPSYVAAGTKTPTQPAMGSCQKNVCDGAGATTTVADDANVPAATTCHVAGCSGGAPTMGNAGDGTPCTSGQCVSGACAPCGGSTQPVCLQGSACSAANLQPVENGQCVDDACAAMTGATCQCGHLSPGQELYAAPGHDTLSSCDGRFGLVMQGDGNLVLYYFGAPLWSSDTYGSGARWAIMQTDGNFVLYTDGGFPVWSSGTAGYPGAYFAAQDDGNLVVYTGSFALWNSGTCCY